MFLSNENEPTAVLSLAVFMSRAEWPTAVQSLPAVSAPSVMFPIPVFCTPLVHTSKANAPTAVFWAPVLKANAL